jgi:hypothetical protein
MTNKNPVRSCEDVDESVLSSAEIKALCIGDERIKEKMNLDIDVSKLRMLEGNHRSQQYRLQDKVLRYYPKEITSTSERITGLEKDFERWNSHFNDEFSMTVSGKTFDKDGRTEAGEAIIQACKNVRGTEISEKIGEYKGFNILVTRHSLTKTTELTLTGLGLKGDGITHQVELSESAGGNIARIDNALNRIPKRLESAKSQLEELQKNLKEARAEMERPFPQANELKEKSARLAELDTLLTMDNRQSKQQEEQAQEDTAQEGMEPTNTDEEGITAAEIPAPTPEDSLQEPVKAGEHAAQAETGEPEKKSERFVPQVDQRVVFHPDGDGGAVKLSGKVLSIEENTITIQAGSKKIPIYKDKGRFELEREPVSIESARKETSGFER